MLRVEEAVVHLHNRRGETKRELGEMQRSNGLRRLRFSSWGEQEVKIWYNYSRLQAALTVTVTRAPSGLSSSPKDAVAQPLESQAHGAASSAAASAAASRVAPLSVIGPRRAVSGVRVESVLQPSQEGFETRAPASLVILGSETLGNPHKRVSK